MKQPNTPLHRDQSWMQRLLMAAEVESAAYQFGLMASPTRINDCLAGDCLERSDELRAELSSHH